MSEYKDSKNKVTLLGGDCLLLMDNIKDKSIDMILCDLPYGVLNKSNPGAKWDSVIPFDTLWKHYLRITKDNAAIVLFGSGMFTADLMESQRKLWRYNLIWNKIQKTGFLNANRMPLRQHEDICVFYKKLPTYNPQMIKAEPHKRNHGAMNGDDATNNCYGDYETLPPVISDEYYPTSIITIGKENFKNSSLHPTQKPVQLLEWLIKTYTNEDDVVLDNCCGSGSTGVACINTNRKFVGMELEDKFIEIARERLGLNMVDLDITRKE